MNATRAGRVGIALLFFAIPVRLAARDAIDRRIDAMTPEERIGQLLMVSCDSTAVDPALRTMLTRWHVGGVVFYRFNIRSAEQLRRLTSEVRRLSAGGPEPFLAIDEEGGSVDRLRDLLPQMPSPMVLGATRSARLARQAGYAAGCELRALGLTMNLAPVLDVDANESSSVGTRAFSDDPNVVGALGSAFIEGESAAGVISVAKHFVGEGSAGGDSHETTIWDQDGRSIIEQRDLVPWRRAMASGLQALMTSHAAVPGLTGEGGMPLTLCRAAVTGVLRGELHFQGMVMTDALEMRSMTYFHDVGELAVESMEAGADMVLTAGTASNRREFTTRF